MAWNDGSFGFKRSWQSRQRRQRRAYQKNVTKEVEKCFKKKKPKPSCQKTSSRSNRKPYVPSSSVPKVDKPVDAVASSVAYHQQPGFFPAGEPEGGKQIFSVLSFLGCIICINFFICSCLFLESFNGNYNRISRVVDQTFGPMIKTLSIKLQRWIGELICANDIGIFIKKFFFYFLRVFDF